MQWCSGVAENQLNRAVLPGWRGWLSQAVAENERNGTASTHTATVKGIRCSLRLRTAFGRNGTSSAQRHLDSNVLHPAGEHVRWVVVMVVEVCRTYSVSVCKISCFFVSDFVCPCLSICAIYEWMQNACRCIIHGGGAFKGISDTNKG